MIRFNHFEILKDAAGRSLKSFQCERSGLPFDPALQNAIFVNDYSASEDFLKEFRECLFNNLDRRENLKEYIKVVYYKLGFYTTLYDDLVQEYHRKFVCEDGRLEFDITKYETLESNSQYLRIKNSFDTLESVMDHIRAEATKYQLASLMPIEEMTSDDFTIDGYYIYKESVIDNSIETNNNKSVSNTGILLGIRTFEELFFDKNDIDRCVRALQEVRKNNPIIDDKRKWIGDKGSKAYLVAWIDRLQSEKILKELPNKTDIIPLLNTFFSELDMGLKTSSLSEQKGGYFDAKDFFSLKIHKKIAR